jgi:hypothetical protein
VEERRRYLRFRNEARLTLRPPEDYARSIEASVADISILGVGAYVSEPIAPGSKVKFELITRLWGTPLAGEGTVIYLNEIQKQDKKIYRVGIDFLVYDKPAIQSIINHIQGELCSKARKKG